MKDLSMQDPFRVLGYGHKLCEIVLVLMGDDGDTFKPFGSGFFIAPGLLITAKHVIEGYWAEYHYRKHGTPFPKRKTERDTNFEVRGMQFVDGRAIDWYSEKVWVSDFTDAAFLYFKPLYKDDKPYTCDINYELTMHPPDVGEYLASFGYAGTKANVIRRTPTFKFNYRAPFTRSIGKVLEVHEKRYSAAPSIASFPCAETNARFENGMSGGPVFNVNGQICGIVSSGLDEASGYKSFPALLWPAMFTGLDIDLKTGCPIEEYRVYDLFRTGYIRQVGWREIFRQHVGKFKEYIDENDNLKYGWLDEKDSVEYGWFDENDSVE